MQKKKEHNPMCKNRLHLYEPRFLKGFCGVCGRRFEYEFPRSAAAKRTPRRGAR